MEQGYYEVFISYRRKGGSEKAQLVKSEIAQRGIDESRIFLDTHSLYDGDFELKIKSAIEHSNSIIVIISKGCFDEIKETDFWYMEIKEALRLNKKVVPIFFDGITSFAGLSVPEELQDLIKMNAVTYQHEYADAAFNKVLLFLGLSSSNTQVQKKKGCLFSFKYKGCLLSITIVALLCLMLHPFSYIYNKNNVGQTPGPNLEVVSKPKENQSTPTKEPVTSSRPFDSDGSVGVDNNEKSKPIDGRLIGRWRAFQDSIKYDYEFGPRVVERTIITNGGTVKEERGWFEIEGNNITFVWPQERQTARLDLNERIMTITYKDGKKIKLTRH